MIQCTDKYIWYKKRRLCKGKRRFSLVLSILLLFFGIVFYYNAVAEQMFNYGQKYVCACSAEVSNTAVMATLVGGIEYNDFINIEKDNNGNIVLISANSYKINSLARQTEKMTATLLKEKIKNGIPIPIMAFSGLSIISGYGKSVNLI